MRVFEFAARGISSRGADASSPMLDLLTGYGLADFWLDTGASMDGLCDFLDPPVTIKGITFDARGAIHAVRSTSDRVIVKEVPVGRHCRRLHFLQTSLSKLEPGSDTLPGDRASSQSLDGGDWEARENGTVSYAWLSIWNRHRASLSATSRGAAVV